MSRTDDNIVPSSFCSILLVVCYSIPTRSLKSWWFGMTGAPSPNHKAISSLTLHTTREIWNERNAQVYRNKHAPPTVIFDNIKKETKVWVIAGA